MADCKLKVEDLLQRLQDNWDQENIEAAFTTLRLYRARDLFFNDSTEIIESFELNRGEFESLASLRNSGPPYMLTPSDICHSNLYSSGGLTKVLNSLEKRKLISRQKDPNDLRSRLVKLTKKGKTLIEKALGKVLQSHEDRLSDCLTKKDREELDRLMMKLHRD